MAENNQDIPNWAKAIGEQLIQEVRFEIPSNPPINQVYKTKTCVKCKQIFSYSNNLLINKKINNKGKNKLAGIDICINCEEVHP